MGWVLKTLELPPEEDAIAKEWFEYKPVRRFLDQVEAEAEAAFAGHGRPLEIKVLGKALEFLGKSLQEAADEAEKVGGNVWDGSDPKPAMSAAEKQLLAANGVVCSLLSVQH